MPDYDAVAVVVDDHTGKVRATFRGLGAEADARSHLRICQKGGVQHLSSASVVVGEEAKKAARSGRI